jgi:predicted DNA-binding ribbon-helix-helix protein
MKRKTAVLKRSVFVNGQKTSVSLEKEFWAGLQAIAGQKGTTASKLTEEIAPHRTTLNLSSAIRIYVYNFYRSLEGAPAVDNTTLAAKSAESDGRTTKARGRVVRRLERPKSCANTESTSMDGIAALKDHHVQNSGRSKDHDGNDRHSGQQAKGQCCLLPGTVLACIIVLKVAECRHRIAPCVGILRA